MYVSIKVLRIFRKEFFGISLNEISHVLAKLFACNVASPGYFPCKKRPRSFSWWEQGIIGHSGSIDRISSREKEKEESEVNLRMSGAKKKRASSHRPSCSHLFILLSRYVSRNWQNFTSAFVHRNNMSAVEFYRFIWSI